MRSSTGVSVILLILALALGGCEGDTSAAKEERKADQQPPLPVTVTPVRAQKVQRTVEFVGTLEANDEVTVASEIDGQIASIGADLGDRIGQGQVLARVRDAEFRYAVEQAEGQLNQTLANLGLTKIPGPDFDVTVTSLVMKSKAELDDAQVNLKRMKVLFDEKVVSAQEYDTADARYKTASAAYQSSVEQAKSLVAEARARAAQLEIARKKLRDTVIRAPLAGSISKRWVSGGEYVKVGAQLFTIVQDRPLKLRGMIPERFAPDVRGGQEIEARVDSFPVKVFKGKLSRISPAADVASRSFLIEAVVDNPERRLKPGFFARATILTRVDPNALTVPQQALVTFAGVTKVFVVVNDVARECVVQRGVRVGGNEVEITAGLRPGELVAISGLTRLVDGAAVKVSGPVMPRDKQEEAREPR